MNTNEQLPKSLLELRGKEYVENLKQFGYQEWWDNHPCQNCGRTFLMHVEGSWSCNVVWKPMDNLSYVEWLNEQNNRRI